MVLYIVGLGLGDERDVTVRGLEAIKSCDKVFLEMYTSILRVDKSRLEAYYGKEVVVADRNMVESEAEQIYEPAREGNVAMLVVGDPGLGKSQMLPHGRRSSHSDILFGCQRIRQSTLQWFTKYTTMIKCSCVY